MKKPRHACVPLVSIGERQLWLSCVANFCVTKRMVGAIGFEPTTLWSQTRCATRLRYAPPSGIVRAVSVRLGATAPRRCATSRMAGT